jgi:hypothetical protein
MSSSVTSSDSRSSSARTSSLALRLVSAFASVGAVVMGLLQRCGFAEHIYHAASRSSSVTIAWPISAVPTRRMFGCMMSPVR